MFSEATLKGDGWKMVARVVNALRAHDESLTGSLLSEVIAQDKLPIRFVRTRPSGGGGVAHNRADTQVTPSDICRARANR